MKVLSYRVLIIGLILIVGYFQAFSQRDTSRYYNPITDDIATKLPPLEALIDSAIANSPQIKIEELDANYSMYEVKSAKIDWLRHFYLDFEFDAGDWTYYDRDEFMPEQRFYLSESRRIATYGGFSVRFPLHAIFDRRNEINRKKKLTEMAMARREWRVRQIRELVVTTYNELIQQQELLRVSNEYQQFGDIYMPIAEMEFKNGEIPASELQRLKDYQTRGAMAFKDIIKRFNDAYWRLEEIVGMKFNLINVQR